MIVKFVRCGRSVNMGRFDELIFHDEGYTSKLLLVRYTDSGSKEIVFEDGQRERRVQLILLEDNTARVREVYEDLVQAWSKGTKDVYLIVE